MACGEHDTVGEIEFELTVVNNKRDRKADRSQVTQLESPRLRHRSEMTSAPASCEVSNDF